MILALAIVLCPSVRLQCVFVTQRCCIILEMTRQIKLLFGIDASFDMLCYREIRVSTKYFSLELCSKLWTLEISPRHVDGRKWCQRSSTNDRRQFITLSVHLCKQSRRSCLSHQLSCFLFCYQLQYTGGGIRELSSLRSD